MSKIIVVEGPDRVGKFTQTHLLQEYITGIGLGATVVEVPIRSAITYRVIYWMLQNGLAKTFPKIFQWFQFINRKIFQVFTLPVLEEHYDFIIMDRWSLSTIVYGIAEGVPKDYTIGLAKKLREPDFTIILFGEAHEHVAEDSYEADVSLQVRVRLEYAKWALENPKMTKFIDCNQDKKIVAEKIKNILQEKRILPPR
jgi:thymidylate kinase